MLSFQYNTIKFYENSPIKNEGSPLLAQNEVRADIFFRFFGSFSIRKGRFRRRAEGGFGGNSARPTNFGRNLFLLFRFAFFVLHFEFLKIGQSYFSPLFN